MPKIEWDSIHAANLKAFLETETGKLVVELLTAMRPLLMDGSHMYKTFVRNGEVRGYELCLDNLHFITTPDFQKKPNATEEAYPNLDDDSKWSN